ncbi:MAG: polysaccharide biosynthesis/export family protein [Phycisphaerae bacterium]|nr:polysaccharide biosynthesis/export family protein [Phycisphaerae bacterium]
MKRSHGETGWGCRPGIVRTNGGLKTGAACLLAAVAAVSAGCMRSWLNDFLDPTEVGRFGGKPVTKEIRTTLGLLDEDAELVSATDPLPEDIIAVPTEYEIGPGDVVEVNIHELIRTGAITTEVRRVSNLGFIDLPIMGRININGLTEEEAQEVVKSKLKPDILEDPIVTVVVREERQRQFSIAGYIARPGPVPISRPDFRIIEALTYAGSLPEEVEKVYVLRRVGRGRRLEATPASEPASKPGAPLAAPSSGPVGKPTTSPESSDSRASGQLREDIDLLLSDIGSGGTASGRSTRAQSGRTTSSSRAAAGRASNSDADTVTSQERQELLEAITPGTSGGSAAGPIGTASGSRTGVASTDPSKGLSKWIWLNGEWVEVQGDAPLPTRPAEEKAEPTQAVAPPTRPESEAVADAGEENRVIGIPLKPLYAGEMRYNIVMQPGDVISIPTPQAGKRYYVMGHVRGPGAYAIPPEGITLTRAIASSGGLDPYAWPSRCEIARKIGPDQQELHQVDLDRVFAMKDQDIQLKPGDVVNVGTSPLSPFLVAIANGFRTTYGFGFVYDRNFGTIDSYGPKSNPEERRRAERNARFPALQAVFPGL